MTGLVSPHVQRRALAGMIFQQHSSTHKQESSDPWEVHAYPNETQAVLHRPWRLALYRAARVRLNHAPAQLRTTG
jgi:hypothetical protein